LKEEWTPFAVSRVSSSEVFPSNEQGRETCTANLERALLSMKDPRPGSPLDIPIVWVDGEHLRETGLPHSGQSGTGCTAHPFMILVVVHIVWIDIFEPTPESAQVGVAP
jgi:hypothetical protein